MKTEIKTGWVKNTASEYHRSEGISSTGIVKMLRSPAHYKYADDSISVETATIGNLIHLAILEPDEFKFRVDVYPDADYRGSGKKEWLNFFHRLHENEMLTMLPEEAIKLKRNDITKAFRDDFIICSRKNYDDAKKIVEAFYNDHYLSDLIRGPIEMSGYIKNNETFIKCRPDCRNDSIGCIIDIKTTTDCNSFYRDSGYCDVIKLDYHTRAALYLDVANALEHGKNFYDNFVWIVIEKSVPFGIRCFSMSINSHLYEIGKSRYLKGYELYKECLKYDNWPCYNTIIQPIDINYYK